ncbi:MAG: adenosylmethionine decarboxylase [Chloroflexi bacterium]|nr:adenosylmethionine decarboxylase [Chloroflexota bacterium]
MNVLGLHLLLELKECNPQLLDNLDYVRNALFGAAEGVGAHVIGESFHQFTPQGVTGILSIAESHISIHTWPEYSYAAADIFTCGSSFQPRDAASVLIDQFESKSPEITEVRRGLLSVPAGVQ